MRNIFQRLFHPSFCITLQPLSNFQGFRLLQLPQRLQYHKSIKHIARHQSLNHFRLPCPLSHLPRFKIQYQNSQSLKSCSNTSSCQSILKNLSRQLLLVNYIQHLLFLLHPHLNIPISSRLNRGQTQHLIHITSLRPFSYIFFQKTRSLLRQT